MNTSYPLPWYLGEGKPSHRGTQLFSKDNRLCGFSYPQNRVSLPSSGESQQMTKSPALFKQSFSVPGSFHKAQPFFLFCPLQLPVPACHSLPSSEYQARAFWFNTKIQCMLAANRRDFPKFSNFPFSPVGPLTQPAAALFLTQ